MIEYCIVAEKYALHKKRDIREAGRMKIRDILGQGKPTISFEVFPPKTAENYESVKEAALEIAKLQPAFMSVTYGAGGRSEERRVGKECNLSCRSRWSPYH